MDVSKSDNKDFQGTKLMNWKSVAIGSIIALIGFIIISEDLIPNMEENLKSIYFLIAVWILPSIIGGFTTAYLNKPTYRVGVINGAIAALIGLIIFDLYDFLNWILPYGVLGDISYIFEDIISKIVPVMLLGAFGAVIGTSIKKLKKKLNYTD